MVNTAEKDKNLFIEDENSNILSRDLVDKRQNRQGKGKAEI